MFDMYHGLKYVPKNVYPSLVDREDQAKPEKIMVRAYLTDLEIASSWSIGMDFEELTKRFKDIEEYAPSEGGTNLLISEHEYGAAYSEDKYFAIIVTCERLETDEEFGLRIAYNQRQIEAKKEREKDDRKKLAELKKRYEGS